MDFITTFFGGGIGAALAAFLGKDWLAKRIAVEIDKEMLIHKAAFELKLDACLEALSVVDAKFARSSLKNTFSVK